MADRFVRVRLLRIQNVDLNLFEFDWDLTWAVFFMHPDGKVYGRYGGRDGTGADGRNSLPGLRYAMEKALETHAEWTERPAPVFGEPLILDKVAAARKIAGGGCIHCHQVKEILRADAMDRGTWKRENLWTYPLPENIGLTLDRDQGHRVQKVLEKSPAQNVGIQVGDWVETINGQRVRSFADAQYALHKAPFQGEVAISWKHGDVIREGKLTLAEGWKKTNITWRPSLLDLLPALTVYGTDLTGDEKKALGLEPERLAFKQKDPVHSRAEAMGVRAGDIILGLDGLKLEMTVDGFLGYVRRNHIVGDRVVLNLIRGGKRVDLPIKLAN